MDSHYAALRPGSIAADCRLPHSPTAPFALHSLADISVDFSAGQLASALDAQSQLMNPNLLSPEDDACLAMSATTADSYGYGR
jgi:hypothetical protein